MVRQPVLVKQRTIGYDSSSHCNKDAASHIPREVDDSRDLLAGFFWQAHGCCGRDGDKTNRDGSQLQHAPPGTESETHGQVDVGRAVVEGKGKEGETPDRKITS